MPLSARSVSADPKSHPRVEHLRARHGHRVRYHSIFTNTDSLASDDSSTEEDVHEGGWLILLITGIFVIAVIIFLTISGTLLFQAIGKREEPSRELPECLEKARKFAEPKINATMNGTEVRQLILEALWNATKCDDANKMILTTSDAAVYSWSLYSTVGYGDMFMHSELGQLVSIVYAFFASALYLAAECGTIISRHLSDFIHFVRITCRKVCKCIKHRDPHIHPLKPFARFLICLCLLLCMMIILTCYMKFFEGKNWSWAKAFYFAYITMALIGLGDVVPTESNKIPFIILTQPLLLVGDTLFAQINWYMQDRLRYGLHSLLRLCQCERPKPGGNTATPIDPEHYPSVTSKMLPMIPPTKQTGKNNKKASKEKRREIKARKKSTNHSLKLIPNETVFGPDRRPASTPTTTTLPTSAPTTSAPRATQTQTKTGTGSAEPITPDLSKEVIVEVDAEKKEKESLL